jgi:hypothetical protein
MLHDDAVGYCSNPVVVKDISYFIVVFNPLNAELNPICPPLAILGAHHIFHVIGLRVKS